MLDPLGFTIVDQLPKPENMATLDLSYALDHWPPAAANAWGQVFDHGRQRYLAEFFKRNDAIIDAQVAAHENEQNAAHAESLENNPKSWDWE